MKKFSVLLPFLGLLSGCVLSGIEGNGVSVSKTFTGETIKSFKVRGSWAIEVQANAPEDKLVITCDENLFEYLNIRYGADTVIRPEKTLRSVTPMRIVLHTTADLDKVDGAGSTKWEIFGASQKHFTLDASGSTTVDLQMPVENLKADLSGSSKMQVAQAEKLNFESSGSASFNGDTIGSAMFDCSGSTKIDVRSLASGKVDCSGSTKIEIENLAGELTGDLSGSAKVSYGGPGNVSCSTSGSSHISKK